MRHFILYLKHFKNMCHSLYFPLLGLLIYCCTLGQYISRCHPLIERKAAFFHARFPCQIFFLCLFLRNCSVLFQLPTRHLLFIISTLFELRSIAGLTLKEKSRSNYARKSGKSRSVIGRLILNGSQAVYNSSY